MTKTQINKLINKFYFFIINSIAYFLTAVLIFLIAYVLYNSLFYFKKKQTLFLNKTQSFVPFKTEDGKEIQIAFIVNKNINTDKISIEDIHNIYNNKISHWGSISDQGIDIIPIASSIDSISNKAILKTLIKNNVFNKRYIKIEPSTKKYFKP